MLRHCRVVLASGGGGERRCLSKRQALEPSMPWRRGLYEKERETTRNKRTGVDPNVDETLIDVADGSLFVTRFAR
ncbi:unnamed protein product [Lasius platythorax]|uniref:Uncharacterized protein n=1 Tax=Lasius platythorax TaxID=488582 RepID=A0AAV2P6I3_9HYME